MFFINGENQSGGTGTTLGLSSFRNVEIGEPGNMTSLNFVSAGGGGGGGGSGLGSERETVFDYDMANRLVGVTDPLGATWSYVYDVFGNRTSADDPGLGAWTMAYDANGNLTLQTDAKGQTIAFAYDAINRPTQKTVTGPPV
ncbi:MAG: hypothetical protein AAFV30_07445, partial [Pseudomonadota bacterium]